MTPLGSTEVQGQSEQALINERFSIQPKLNKASGQMGSRVVCQPLGKASPEEGAGD